MPELPASVKRYGAALFLAGLLLGIGIGYVGGKWLAKSELANAPAPVPPGAALPPPAGSARSQPAEAWPQAATAGERRARMQAFMERLTPEQQARAAELRARLRQNAAEWRDLTPEARQQRMAEMATNTLGLAAEALGRLQSRFNLTPEQQERWRECLQEWRERRSRAPR